METITKVFLWAIVLSLLLCFPAYPQEIYRWVDKEGNVNFATRYDWIPEEYRSQVPPPPPGKRLETRASDFATEGEIRDFFADYTERYNQKDIDGFLSLFSTEAVQNDADQFDVIKKMYTEFFDRSRKLSYHLEDLGIEVYQNSVEARARYELGRISKMRGRKRSWKGDIRWVLIRENEALRIRFLNYQSQESY